ncbi:MAG: hypothetical protein HZB92_04575 [Euryarchaeota archaeon]|nr:hypothetical protein [Euryarchaeota archaeon]
MSQYCGRVAKLCLSISIVAMLAVPLGIASTVPDQTIPLADETNPGIDARIQPWTIWGYSYLDGVLVTPGWSILTVVNDTIWGSSNVLAGGLYSSETLGDDTSTWWVRDGAFNGDTVYYLLKVDNETWYCANETCVYSAGGISNINLHFITPRAPRELKISSLTPNPTSGNDTITLFNPSNDTISLDNWFLRDRDNWTIPLTGMTIGAWSERPVDLGGDVLSNATEGGPTSGDEMALCWKDPLGTISGGNWVAMDQVEYGNQYNFYDNTTLWDYATTPQVGFKLIRSPDLYTDSENCTNDFVMAADSAPLSSCLIPLSPGWNLVSIPLVQQNTSIGSALSSVSGKWDRAQRYDENDAANQWKQYYSGWSASLNDLTTLDHTVGFWLNATEACVLNVTGAEPSSTQISLCAGWNLIGYPARDDSAYSVANLRTETGATIVEGFDAGTTYRTSPKADSYTLKKGEGYWVYVPSATTWTVNW